MDMRLNATILKAVRPTTVLGDCLMTLLLTNGFNIAGNKMNTTTAAATKITLEALSHSTQAMVPVS